MKNYILSIIFIALIMCYCKPSQPQTETEIVNSDQSHNTLTENEKAEGWKLLFNGTKIDQWRGINSESFPDSGWKIIDGELKVYATDGGESVNGGDIITKERYSYRSLSSLVYKTGKKNN